MSGHENIALFNSCLSNFNLIIQNQRGRMNGLSYSDYYYSMIREESIIPMYSMHQQSRYLSTNNKPKQKRRRKKQSI